MASSGGEPILPQAHHIVEKSVASESRVSRHCIGTELSGEGLRLLRAPSYHLPHPGYDEGTPSTQIRSCLTTSDMGATIAGKTTVARQKTFETHMIFYPTGTFLRAL